MFGIERGGGDMAAVKTAIRVVRNGEILGLYPEGTRSKDGQPGRAKTGVALIAKAAKCDVVPAAVICRGKMPEKRLLFNRGRQFFANSDRPTFLRISEREAAAIFEQSKQLFPPQASVNGHGQPQNNRNPCFEYKPGAPVQNRRSDRSLR